MTISGARAHLTRLRVATARRRARQDAAPAPARDEVNQPSKRMLMQTISPAERSLFGA
jgi:hypothetical protein